MQNDLVLKLAKESGFKTDWQHADVQAIKSERYHVFAELIVRECGKWVNDNVGLIDDETMADMLRHFGVKNEN